MTRCDLCGSRMEEEIAEEQDYIVVVRLTCPNPKCGADRFMVCAKTNRVKTPNCKPTPAVR